MIKCKNIFISSCLNLIYPPLCLHCDEIISQNYLILCKKCIEDLPFANSGERCKRCYGTVSEGAVHPFCTRCFKKPSPFYRTLAPFEWMGPVISLHSKMKSLPTSFLSHGLAAFMAHSYLKTSLSLPEGIVLMPDSLLNRVWNGESSACLLAKAMSEIFQVPLLRVLKADLNGYALKNKVDVRNKKLLLVTDALDEKFFEAGEALMEGYPHSIMGLGLFTCE